MIDLNILGVHGVTVTVPVLSEIESYNNPEKVMHHAKKRFAADGAKGVTLVPCRGGKGWKKED